MKTPYILDPTKSSSVRAPDEKFEQHPGPFRIGLRDLYAIFPGMEDSGFGMSKYPDAVYGETNTTETYLIGSVTRWLEPRVVVEIGTFRGRSTRIMAEESPEYARVLTVDLPDEERQTRIPPNTSDLPFLRSGVVGEAYSDSRARTKITQVRMDATSSEFAQELERFLSGDTIDLALIDPAHDYDTTRDSFDAVLWRMSPGGVVLFDDYDKIRSHVGPTLLALERAVKDGYLFYHFSPDQGELSFPISDRPSGMIHLNLPGTRNGKWREALG